MSSPWLSLQTTDRLLAVEEIRISRFGTLLENANSLWSKMLIKTGSHASNSSKTPRTLSLLALHGTRPSRSGTTKPWVSSIPLLDIRLKSTPSLWLQRLPILPRVAKMVLPSSGILLMENSLDKLKLNHLSMLSSSLLRNIGSFLELRPVSRSGISQQRSSLLTSKPLLLKMQLKERTKSSAALAWPGTETETCSSPALLTVTSGSTRSLALLETSRD